MLSFFGFSSVASQSVAFAFCDNATMARCVLLVSYGYGPFKNLQ